MSRYEVQAYLPSVCLVIFGVAVIAAAAAKDGSKARSHVQESSTGTIVLTRRGGNAGLRPQHFRAPWLPLPASVLPRLEEPLANSCPGGAWRRALLAPPPAPGDLFGARLESSSEEKRPMFHRRSTWGEACDAALLSPRKEGGS